MKRIGIFLLVLCVFGVSWAQPEEETEAAVEESSVEKLDSESAIPTQNLPEEIKDVDEGVLKNVDFAPMVQLQPLGFDNINLGGGESDKYFFTVYPSFDLGTSFKTSHDQIVNFDIFYDLRWREYLNKSGSKRDFENKLEGVLHIPWTEQIATSANSLFIHFFKSGADSAFNNAIVVESEPKLIYSPRTDLELRLGQWFQYVNVVNWKVPFDQVDAITDLPTDAGDLRRGVFTENAIGFDEYNPIDIFSGSVLPTTLNDESVWLVSFSVTLGTTYTPISGTTLSGYYRYVFANFSNFDAAELGHAQYIEPKLNQELPWWGGSIEIKDEIRLQKAKYSLVPGTDALAQDLRNRFTVEFKQQINEAVSAGVFYQHQLTGKNEDDYSNLDSAHYFYTALNIAF